MKVSTGITSLDIICALLTCFFTFRLITSRRRIPKGLRLPPGPPGKFFWGNVADMPKDREPETFDRWAKEYGGLVHITILGKSTIFVNSAEIAHDLFEKRSSIYSDRPHATMMIDLMGWDWNFGVHPYGEWWRRHRKMFHHQFSPEAATSFYDAQIRLTREFLGKLRDSPTEFVDHIRHLAGAITMEVVYGIKVLPKGDPYIEIAETAVAAASIAGSPGRFLVDTLPFLKYVPEWMPGAGFRRQAREWRVPTIGMASMPFMAVKKALEAGTALPSVTAKLLEDLSHQNDVPDDEEIVIRNIAGVAYAAGSDTTVSAMTTFFLAMVLYPEVQRKAQLEVDAVVGNRLPSFEDLPNLPYVNALCKEVHRWHPSLPFGIAHRLMQDDVYGEYFLPKGSVVIGNAWTILHDEKTYGPNHDVFDPERFFIPGIIDPVGHFGFGRRICPGRYMADNSILIAVSSVLKAFNISHAKDSKGDDIPVTAAFGSGFISHPEKFHCTIQVRSEAAKTLIANPEVD